MIFNRFIPPLRGGGDTPRMIELFLDWGKLEIFGKIQPIRPPPPPPPQNTTGSSLGNSTKVLKIH